MTLREIIEQLESCNYECEAGSLERNIAFIELKERVEFIEGLIENGLNLEDEFAIGFIWNGGNWDAVANQVLDEHHELWKKLGNM